MWRWPRPAATPLPTAAPLPVGWHAREQYRCPPRVGVEPAASETDVFDGCVPGAAADDANGLVAKAR